MGANYYCVGERAFWGNNLMCATCRYDGTNGWKKGT